LELQRDAHPPGIRRLTATGAEQPLFETMRTVATVGDGGPVHSSGSARLSGLVGWRREGRLRWFATRTFGGDEYPASSLLCVDARHGAAPCWLRFLPAPPADRPSVFVADLDGDGRDDVAVFDAASHRLWTAGVRATVGRAAVPAPLETPVLHASTGAD